MCVCRSEQLIVMEGAGHCANWYPSSPTDTSAIASGKLARIHSAAIFVASHCRRSDFVRRGVVRLQDIAATIANWVHGEFNDGTSPTSTAVFVSAVVAAFFGALLVGAVAGFILGSR